MGAVGQGLVVEEDSLRGLVRLEELVALLPVLDRLLQALGPSLSRSTVYGGISLDFDHVTHNSSDFHFTFHRKSYKKYC
jgi:hypothetical protein